MVFDTRLGYGLIKAQVATMSHLYPAHTQDIEKGWQMMRNWEPTDGEACIYQQNFAIKENSQPHITLVVVTNFNGQDNWQTWTSRSILQGICVAQAQYNSEGDKFKLRILIANFTDPAKDASTVARWIKQLHEEDSSLVGVVGWPIGSDGAVDILNDAHIPIVSPIAFSESMVKGRPYFFSVAPSLEKQAEAASVFAQQHGISKVAIFYDQDDQYSTDLEATWAKSFHTSDVVSFSSTDNNIQQLAMKYIPAYIKDSQDQLVLFAGHPIEASQFLQYLHENQYQVPVLGGDALYQAVNCPDSECPSGNFTNFYYTSPAFPDEAAILGQTEPSFFREYIQQFDPQKEHIRNPYGYGRPDSDVIMAYDAVAVFLQASKRMGGQPDSEGMRLALSGITGQQAFIAGAGGQISFGSDGIPQGKAVLLLWVNRDGDRQFHQEDILVGHY